MHRRWTRYAAESMSTTQLTDVGDERRSDFERRFTTRRTYKAP
jgi:hypothetical protein